MLSIICFEASYWFFFELLAMNLSGFIIIIQSLFSIYSFFWAFQMFSCKSRSAYSCLWYGYLYINPSRVICRFDVAIGYSLVAGYILVNHTCGCAVGLSVLLWIILLFLSIVLQSLLLLDLRLNIWPSEIGHVKLIAVLSFRYLYQIIYLLENWEVYIPKWNTFAISK